MKLSSEKLAHLTAQFALSKKADNVVCLDLRELTTMADFFVICTALSETHMKSISEGVRRGIRKKYKEHVWHVEGEKTAKWILLDYVNVVVHIFRKDERDFYALERLWADAKTQHWDASDIDEDAIRLPQSNAADQENL